MLYDIDIYYKEKRSKLVVSHENHNYNAMNEVVIMTNKPAKMLHFEIQVDGDLFKAIIKFPAVEQK